MLRSTTSENLRRLGYAVAVIGMVLPLLLIGALKFTQPEIEGLKPLIGSAPWLYPLLGPANTSYLLGVIEILAAVLVLASPVSPRAGVLGGLLAAVIFLVTSSLLSLSMAWDFQFGIPALGPIGQFLVKDVALLGIAIFVAGHSLERLRPRAQAL